MKGLQVWALCLLCWLAQPAHAAETVRYIHTDALGSVVAVTDTSGAVIERREYEPYGAQLSPAVADGPGYTGHVQDAATGLTYMQQRYYDPGIGVFLSVDPVTALGNPVGQFHRYRYANGNPYSFIDPDGREAKGGCGTHVKDRDSISCRSGDTAQNSPPTNQQSPEASNGGGGGSSGRQSYDSSESGYHFYEVNTPACDTAQQHGCSAQTVFYQGLLYQPFPGPRLEAPASNGQITSVPGFGLVRTLVYPDHLLIRNETLPGHLLHPGEVSRQVLQGGSQVFIRTTGTGTGLGWGSWAQILGAPFLWHSVDIQLRQSLPVYPPSP
ncbi:hypothetical protein H0E84_06935 [Luteimonas sp. SJ-92]|uniref:Teneurin-like YD-shell domain-containing protein n=1 Tax=Luteimonas salinisoli TaxID=2752307 RepID=A0A853JA71_9GAMM|nr:RHS repeat-associated core domain-containing protein [Luteimonas salinisoli]NZA26116.1 hypothetical protein [Luteimonas salinisoli]